MRGNIFCIFFYISFLFEHNVKVCERGNKLNEVEEKTEQMANDAKVSFSSRFVVLLILIGSSPDLGGHIKTAVGQIQKQKVVPVVRKTQSDRSMAFYSQILLRSEG